MNPLANAAWNVRNDFADALHKLDEHFKLTVARFDELKDDMSESDRAVCDELLRRAVIQYTLERSKIVTNLQLAYEMAKIASA